MICGATGQTYSGSTMYKMEPPSLNTDISEMCVYCVRYTQQSYQWAVYTILKGVISGLCTLYSTELSVGCVHYTQQSYQWDVYTILKGVIGNEFDAWRSVSPG